MKKILISTAIIGLLSVAPLAFAQSTVTGTLSSGSSATTTSTSTLSGSVGSGNSLSGTVGSGNSLTGTVTSTSTSSGGGGGGSSGGGGNGPPAGGGGGGGSGATIICPNLPNSLFTLPAGYEIINGNCDPVGSVLGASTSTVVPGVPNTGAGGNAEENDLVLLASGLIGTFASVALFRKYFTH
jgi:hypothetical protein